VRVAVATDHGGFALKSTVMDAVREAGHDPLDLGTHSTDPVDYPDFAAAAARAVQDGRAERAIVLCGSGVGAAIAANKLAGIRAGVCHDVYSAHQAVEHDDVNVLALGARVIGPSLATDLVRTFLATRYTAEPRHVRRVAKLTALERDGGGDRHG
jgi:RpiB/LacA/LacB family sugar-phosphate isomerase